MVLEILAFLPPKEIGRASRISRDIRNLSGDSFMWRTICLRSFPFCSVDKVKSHYQNHISNSFSTERTGNTATSLDPTLPKVGKEVKPATLKLFLFAVTKTTSTASVFTETTSFLVQPTTTSKFGKPTLPIQFIPLSATMA